MPSYGSRHSSVRVIGKAPLPANPPRLNLRQLETGTSDGKWVEVKGVIHSFVLHERGSEFARDYVTMQLSMRDGMIGVSMPQEPGVDYSSLIDNKELIQANAAPMFNRNDQMMGARLMASGIAAIQVLEAGSSDPFQDPITPIEDLLRWDQQTKALHRVHVRGNVTLLWPGSSFCIRDATRGICAQSAQSTPLALGEVADVVGFAKAENGSPILTDATYQSMGKGDPVAAKPVTAEQALLGRVVGQPFQPKSRTDYDSELIQIQGVLIGSDLTSVNPALLLASGNTIFSAILPNSPDGSKKTAWAIGSRLRVTGICSVRLDTSSSITGGGVAAAKSFRVLMRSPGDVVVLARPSWWTPTHAMIVLALALTLTLVVLAWVVMLRQRIRESEERFRHLALHDALTGLATRLLLQDRLDNALESTRRHETGLALLMMDLDKFKLINDSFGHHAGDEVLRVTASRLQDAVRKSDTVARMGGDEFLVLLPDLSDPKMAESIAANIVKTLSVPIHFEGRDLPVSVSVGVCTASPGDLDAETLLKNVDAALYCAKAHGRNRFAVFTPESDCSQMEQVL